MPYAPAGDNEGRRKALRSVPDARGVPVRPDELSAAEKRVLLALRDGAAATPEEIREAAGFRALVEVMNAASWLRAKGLAVIRERVRRHYSLARRSWGTRNLPERVLLREVRKLRGTCTAKDLQRKSKLPGDDFSIALGWLRKKGWAEVTRGEQTTVRITPRGEEAYTVRGPDEELLARLAKGELPEEDVDPQVLRLLKGRQEILKEREEVRREIALTDAGKAIAQAGLEIREEVGPLTPELLSGGGWRSVEFRRYDVRAFAPSVFPGKSHPLTEYLERVRRAFLALGFTEIEGNFVQPAFWPFDALFQPQDHPARDMLDTFYVDAPPADALPPADVIARIARTHRDGGGTGSRGWQYEWSEAGARVPVLRPHTTGDTIRHLAAHPTPPQKAFMVGQVFRREAIDATHLPLFLQIEGVVMEEGADLGMLIGILTEFYRQMGFEKVRIRPAFFPYTEPSLEPEVWFQGRWMELGGAGIFRPEVTRPLGIDTPVLAWGLGLERLVMAMEGVKDIRELYLSDLDWLRSHRVVR